MPPPVPKQKSAGISGGMIGAIVGICVVVVAIGLVVYFLTRQIERAKVRNYAECKFEKTYAVCFGSREYWLGSVTNGMALLTYMQMPTESSISTTVQYILTDMSLYNESTIVQSPMTSNLDTTTVLQPRAPPQLATFCISTFWPEIKTVSDFVTHTGVTMVPMTNSHGDLVANFAGLAMTTVPSNVQGAHVCFMCAADGTPLGVVGGAVFTEDPEDPASVPYSLGFMPLTSMLASSSSSAQPLPPKVGFLLAYPAIPFMGSVTYSIDADTPVGTRLSMPNRYQSFGDPATTQTVTPELKCDFAKDMLPSPALAGELGNINTVLGCQRLTVPAFDIVRPADADTPSTFYYFQGLLDSKQTGCQHVSLGADMVARVGTLGGIGIIRMRKWTIPTDVKTADKLNDNESPLVTQAANFTDTTIYVDRDFPYASQMVNVPRQYVPAANAPAGTTATTAVSLLYTDPSKHGYPFTLPRPTGGTFAALCDSDPTTAGSHVFDPAIAPAAPNPSATPTPAADEPILTLLACARSYTQGGVQRQTQYDLVLGWGLVTGNIYLRCGASTTAMSSPADLQTPHKPCATCMEPVLTARTFCWPGQYPSDNGDPNGAPSSSGTPAHLGQKTLILAQPDKCVAPYVALGAAAGPTTTSNGAHLGAVMPWVPMLTVPTGDGSRRGYGRYIGIPDGATDFTVAYPAVCGICPGFKIAGTCTPTT
jgi:hypothetical protein